jgi:hypothetical protein
VSPFTFFRGAAAVMAADLAEEPAAGLRAQLCGDAHLSNFGSYAVPQPEPRSSTASADACALWRASAPR